MSYLRRCLISINGQTWRRVWEANDVEQKMVSFVRGRMGERREQGNCTVAIEFYGTRYANSETHSMPLNTKIDSHPSTLSRHSSRTVILKKHTIPCIWFVARTIFYLWIKQLCVSSMIFSTEQLCIPLYRFPHLVLESLVRSFSSHELFRLFGPF